MKVKPFSDVRLTAVSATFNLFFRVETGIGIFNYQNKSHKQKVFFRILTVLIIAVSSAYIIMFCNFDLFIDDGEPTIKKVFFFIPVLLHLLHHVLYVYRGNLFMGRDVEQFISIVYKMDVLLKIPVHDKTYAKTHMKTVVMLCVCIFIQSTIWFPLNFVYGFSKAQLCAWMYLYLPKELTNVVLYIYFDVLAERLKILSDRLEIFLPSIAHKMIFYKYDELQAKVNWKKARSVKVSIRDLAGAYKCIAELNEKIIEVHSLEVLLKLIIAAIYLYDGLWMTLSRTKTFEQELVFLFLIWLWTVMMVYLIPVHCVALERLSARRQRILTQLHDITVDCNHGMSTREDAKTLAALVDAYTLKFSLFHLVDLDVSFVFRVAYFFSTVIVVMLQIRDFV